MVYIKCAEGDGTFDAPAGVKNDIEAATKKLSFNARLLQTFTAESLYQHGLGHHTFRLEEDEMGSPKVHVFNSSLTMTEALKLNGDQLYREFSKGIVDIMHTVKPELLVCELDQSINQSVSQPVIHESGRQVGRLGRQAGNAGSQSVSEPVIQSFSHSVSQSVSQPASQSACQ